MNELTSFQAAAANIALHKLLHGDTFYISDLDGIAKLVGAQMGGPDYIALRGMHCMKWAEVPEPLRTQAKEKIIELLGLPPIVMEAERTTKQAEPEPEPARNRLRLAFWKA